MGHLCVSDVFTVVRHLCLPGRYDERLVSRREHHGETDQLLVPAVRVADLRGGTTNQNTGVHADSQSEHDDTRRQPITG